MKRRDFLKATATLFGGFTLQSYTSPLVRALASSSAYSDKVLVLVQLSGGNDGLNTVIPLEHYSNYYNARPDLAIAESSVLRLNEKTGLHPSMTAMRNLYTEGKLSIVQAVGYPTPNYSHFRSTDIWMSGSDSEESIPSGFAGRFLGTEYPGFPAGFPSSTMPDPLAIQIGYTTPLVLQGQSAGMGVCINNPDYFYGLLNGVQEPSPSTVWGEELDFVRLISRQTNEYSTVIKNAASNVTQQGTYPSSDLANQLKIVARLIKGGLKTRVYVVGMSGFDTHSQQLAVHANLLQTVSESVAAFMKDLEGLGIDDRVVGMTFSEFGRRIKSNGSMGTDHGAASPLFVFGKNVQGGIVGSNPILPSSPTVYDNVPFQHDFRSVYASLLKNWFCVEQPEMSSIMLNKNFQTLPIVGQSSCNAILPLTERNPITVNNLNSNPDLTNYPNPFKDVTRISFKSKGGHLQVQIMDSTGTLIETLADKTVSAGMITMDFDGTNLAAGVYYLRVQDDSGSQVRSMLKVK